MQTKPDVKKTNWGSTGTLELFGRGMQKPKETGEVKKKGGASHCRSQTSNDNRETSKRGAANSVSGEPAGGPQGWHSTKKKGGKGAKEKQKKKGDR